MIYMAGGARLLRQQTAASLQCFLSGDADGDQCIPLSWWTEIERLTFAGVVFAMLAN